MSWRTRLLRLFAGRGVCRVADSHNQACRIWPLMAVLMRGS